MGNDKWTDPNYTYEDGDEFGDHEIKPEDRWDYKPPESDFVWFWKMLGLLLLLIVLVIFWFLYETGLIHKLL